MLTIHAEERGKRISIPKNEFELVVNKLKKLEEVQIVKDDFIDLVDASSVNLQFWNNELDDAIWNNA